MHEVVVGPDEDLDRLGARKVVVERGPPWPPSSLPGGFSCRSLAEVGEEAFADALAAAAEGDPFEPADPRPPCAALRDLVALAGEAFDPDGWFILREGATPAGVVLPRVFEDDETLGSLFYVGVLPSHRGRRLGRGLHAWGLARVAARGAERYVGSSDTRNAAMLRIFERNGCTPIGGQRFYAPPAT